MNEHIFVIGKNEKEYNYKQLTNILGNPVFDKYKLDELLQYSAVKLNKIIKTERKIIPSSRWKNDERIIIILWGHEEKCNHFKTDENGLLTSLCKQIPSKDDSNKENGRCVLMGGKQRSANKRKRKAGGNTSTNMRGNNHSLRTGVHFSGKAKIPPKQHEIFEMLLEHFNVDEEFIKKHPFLYNSMRRLAFLEAQMQYVADEIGFEYMNPEEHETEYIKTEDYDRENLEYHTVPFNPLIITKYNDKTKIAEKKVNKKVMNWGQYTNTVNLIHKMGLDIENQIAKINSMDNTVEHDFDYIPQRYDPNSYVGDNDE